MIFVELIIQIIYSITQEKWGEEQNYRADKKEILFFYIFGLFKMLCHSLPLICLAVNCCCNIFSLKESPGGGNCS